MVPPAYILRSLQLPGFVLAYKRTVEFLSQSNPDYLAKFNSMQQQLIQPASLCIVSEPAFSRDPYLIISRRQRQNLGVEETEQQPE